MDLDPQAVDIARLNLMLRALARRERLPYLQDTIQWGNSLISGPAGELEPYFGEAWGAKRPFNWEERFPQAMAEGGFDVVIGNPPYVEIRGIPEAERSYFRGTYSASATGNFDLYVLFIQRGLELLKPEGRLGFITSGKFLRSIYGKGIRQYIKEHAAIESLVDLSSLEVFPEATTYPVMMVLRKNRSPKLFPYLLVPSDSEPELDPSVLDLTKAPTVPQDSLAGSSWPPTTKPTRLVKSPRPTRPLGDLASVFHGMQTNADPVFICEVREPQDQKTRKVFSKATDRTHLLEGDLLHPFLMGRNVRPWHAGPTGRVVLFPYKNGSTELIPWAELTRSFPLTAAYLEENRHVLESRENGKLRNAKWYGYSYLKNMPIPLAPKRRERG